MDWQGSEPNWLTALDTEQFSTWLSYNALGDGVKNMDSKRNQQHQRSTLADNWPVPRWGRSR